MGTGALTVAEDRAVAQSEREQEQLRAELEAANRRVAELYKMASLGRLLAGVVHEINTPISSILTNNEVMARSLEKLNSLLSSEMRLCRASTVSDSPLTRASKSFFLILR